jgi:anaerobic sulfite reductase subunit C
MKWTTEAEEAVSRVPFFVRRRVKKRVEEEAVRRGDQMVDMRHVQECRQKFLKNMDQEVKGYQVETCFGPGGCPNRAVVDDDLAKKLEQLLARKELRKFLKERVKGPLKMHHEFRVSASDCPNACSRPQIADLGLIGANRPEIVGDDCNQCGECVEICRENAISLEEDSDSPQLDAEKCLSCGQCIEVCPTGTLIPGRSGYRVLVGGKLGRHPRLAEELQGIYSKEEVLNLVEKCLDLYMKESIRGERFGEILKRTGTGPLTGDDKRGE